MSEQMTDNRLSLDWQLRNGTGLDAALCLKAANRIAELEDELERLRRVVKVAFDLLPQSPTTAKALLSRKSSGGKVALRTTAEAKEDGDE